jgi:hypothetical protein
LVVVDDAMRCYAAQEVCVRVAGKAGSSESSHHLIVVVVVVAANEEGGPGGAMRRSERGSATTFGRQAGKEREGV